MDAETLRAAARWLDEEYRRKSAGHVSDPRETAALGVIADAAASLRSWAASGREPQHCPETRRAQPKETK